MLYMEAQYMGQTPVLAMLYMEAQYMGQTPVQTMLNMEAQYMRQTPVWTMLYVEAQYMGQTPVLTMYMEAQGACHIHLPEPEMRTATRFFLVTPGSFFHACDNAAPRCLIFTCSAPGEDGNHFDKQHNFIAKCQYTDYTGDVLWCQVLSSHICSNHKTLNYNNSK